jgi:hypothetical protein
LKTYRRSLKDAREKVTPDPKLLKSNTDVSLSTSEASGARCNLIDLFDDAMEGRLPVFEPNVNFSDECADYAWCLIFPLGETGNNDEVESLSHQTTLEMSPGVMDSVAVPHHGLELFFANHMIKAKVQCSIHIPKFPPAQATLMRSGSTDAGLGAEGLREDAPHEGHLPPAPLALSEACC